MKNILFVLFFFSVIMGCSQESTYKDYKEILRKDTDFISHIRAIQKDVYNITHGNYGNMQEVRAWMAANPINLENVDADHFKSVYVEHYKKAGMQNAEEAYDLRLMAAKTLKVLREKHKFLEKMSINDINALFNEIEQTYPEFKLDPMDFTPKVKH